MSSNDKTAGDPFEFLKGMWGSMGLNIPGMVTPTLDVDELDKRITDLKTVEGWLKMNLNMLSMSIQALEVQRAALGAVQAMRETAAAGGEGAQNPFMNAAMWPWNLMPQAGSPAPDSSKANTSAPEASTKTKKNPTNP